MRKGLSLDPGEENRIINKVNAILNFNAITKRSQIIIVYFTTLGSS